MSCRLGDRGAVGIECRQNDSDILALLQPLEHSETRCCVNAERGMNTRLNGGCQVPIACLAQLQSVGEGLQIRGLVGEADGSRLLRTEVSGPRVKPLHSERRLRRNFLHREPMEIFQHWLMSNRCRCMLEGKTFWLTRPEDSLNHCKPVPGQGRHRGLASHAGNRATGTGCHD